jgi:hypothetical protein
MKKLRFSAGCAQVAELADALASGASGRKVVEVRVLSWAPYIPTQRDYDYLAVSALSMQSLNSVARIWEFGVFSMSM